MYNCTEEVNYTSAAAVRIRYLKEKRELNTVHVMPSHLCSELDEPPDPSNDESEEDAEVFETRIVTSPLFSRHAQ